MDTLRPPFTSLIHVLNLKKLRDYCISAKRDIKTYQKRRIFNIILTDLLVFNKEHNSWIQMNSKRIYMICRNTFSHSRGRRLINMYVFFKAGKFDVEITAWNKKYNKQFYFPTSHFPTLDVTCTQRIFGGVLLDNLTESHSEPWHFSANHNVTLTDYTGTREGRQWKFMQKFQQKQEPFGWCLIQLYTIHKSTVRQASGLLVTLVYLHQFLLHHSES